MPQPEMTPEQRVLHAAEQLVQTSDLTYGYERSYSTDYVTPIPTCVGCDASSWGEIQHSPDCKVEELIAAVLASQHTPSDEGGESDPSETPR